MLSVSFAAQTCARLRHIYLILPIKLNLVLKNNTNDSFFIIVFRKFIL
jgi:hypothetical protein